MTGPPPPPAGRSPGAEFDASDLKVLLYAHSLGSMLCYDLLSEPGARPWGLAGDGVDGNVDRRSACRARFPHRMIRSQKPVALTCE